MRKLAISLLMSMLSVAASAQDQEGDITIKKSFGGLKFYQEGRILKPREVLNIMEPNPEAFKAFKKAKANYDAANVFGFISGFMIGWPLGTALGGGEPQWGIAAGGAAVLLIAIPLSISYKKHARNAVDLYNSDKAESTSLRTKVNLNFAGTVAKVTVTF